MEDIISLLQKRMPEFSRRQQIIAKYILDNCGSAAFMTAMHLAKEVGVSESTVVRFSKELGFEGYPQLRKALQHVVRGRFSADRDIFDSAAAPTGNIMSDFVEADVERLRSARSISNAAAMIRALNAVISAGQIFVAGSYTMGGIAEYFRRSLAMIRERVYTADVSSSAAELSRMKAGDALILVSLSRQTEEEHALIEYAQERFALIISIGAQNPAAQISIAAESAAAVVSLMGAALEAAGEHYGVSGPQELDRFIVNIEGHGDSDYA